MKAKCISDSVNANLHDSWIYDWANTEEQLELTIGKVYVVLAVAKYSNNYFFYVIGDESNDYPLAFPIQFFEIINYEISRYWDFDLKQITSVEDFKINNQEVVSFKEWKNQGDIFYEKILEEEKEAVYLFKINKNKMLSE